MVSNKASQQCLHLLLHTTHIVETEPDLTDGPHGLIYMNVMTTHMHVWENSLTLILLSSLRTTLVWRPLRFCKRRVDLLLSHFTTILQTIHTVDGKTTD